MVKQSSFYISLVLTCLVLYSCGKTSVETDSQTNAAIAVDGSEQRVHMAKISIRDQASVVLVDAAVRKLIHDDGKEQCVFIEPKSSDKSADRTIQQTWKPFQIYWANKSKSARNKVETIDGTFFNGDEVPTGKKALGEPVESFEFLTDEHLGYTSIKDVGFVKNNHSEVAGKIVGTSSYLPFSSFLYAQARVGKDGACEARFYRCDSNCGDRASGINYARYKEWNKLYLYPALLQRNRQISFSLGQY